MSPRGPFLVNDGVYPSLGSTHTYRTVAILFSLTVGKALPCIAVREEY
jgi:hypothetical protein